MINRVPGASVRMVAAAAVFAVVAGVSSLASAVSFSGSYQVNANSGNGLIIQTAELADPLNFVLNNPGDMYTVNLFDIWTDETDVGSDDLNSKPISVDFNFSAPPSLGSVHGTTVGGSIIITEWGTLTWAGPEVLDFGNGGKLQVSLTNETFNGGFFGLKPGRAHGATVEATFKLVSDSVVVPLPASLPLFMGALGGLALLRRRSRAEA